MEGAQTTAPHPVQELRSPGGHSGPEREGGPAFSRRETGRRGFAAIRIWMGAGPAAFLSDR